MWHKCLHACLRMNDGLKKVPKDKLRKGGHWIQRMPIRWKKEFPLFFSLVSKKKKEKKEREKERKKQARKQKESNKFRKNYIE